MQYYKIDKHENQNKAYHDIIFHSIINTHHIQFNIVKHFVRTKSPLYDGNMVGDIKSYKIKTKLSLCYASVRLGGRQINAITSFCKKNVLSHVNDIYVTFTENINQYSRVNYKYVKLTKLYLKLFRRCFFCLGCEYCKCVLEKIDTTSKMRTDTFEWDILSGVRINKKHKYNNTLSENYVMYSYEHISHLKFLFCEIFDKSKLMCSTSAILNDKIYVSQLAERMG